jgi:FkbM family methyltransferase
LLGRDFYLQIDSGIAHQRFGSVYGGWDLVTKDLHPGSVIYSFGVGKDVSFDLELIQRFGVTVHAFDPTPGSIIWVEQQSLPREFVLHKYGLAASDGQVTFYPPENPEHISHSMLEKTSTNSRTISVPVKCLRSIMHELGHTSIDVLKMDIEGAEYEVLDDVFRCKLFPGQILVEFHHRFTGEGIGITRRAVSSLKKSGYRLFSVSATVEEFCFIKMNG